MTTSHPWMEEGLALNLSSTVDLRILPSDKVIPQDPGAYIMQSQRVEYPYPWDTSPVFYIGSASNLRRRLWTKHRAFCNEIWHGRRDQSFDHYYALYEYAGAHGCRVCWIVCRDTKDAKALENNLIIAFAKKHGVWPVANQRGAYLVKPLNGLPSQ